MTEYEISALIIFGPVVAVYFAAAIRVSYSIIRYGSVWR